MPPKFRFIDADTERAENRAQAAATDVMAWAAATANLKDAEAKGQDVKVLQDALRTAERKMRGHAEEDRLVVLRTFMETWEREYVSHETQRDLQVRGAVEDDGIDHDGAMAALETGLAEAGTELDRLVAAVKKQNPDAAALVVPDAPDSETDDEVEAGRARELPGPPLDPKTPKEVEKDSAKRGQA